MICPRCGAELEEAQLWYQGKRDGKRINCIRCCYQAKVPEPRPEPRLPDGQGRLEI